MDWLSRNSYWHSTWPHVRQAHPPLDQHVHADVAILGAGITGLTAALHLKRAGRRVVVLEAGRLGAGTTGGTSGHLEAMPDQGAQTLIDDFGDTAAREVTQARMAAIAQIEQWCRELTNDCEFQRIPAFVYSETEDGAAALERECAAARRLGLAAAPVAHIDLPFATAGGFRIENQARFHSLKYLAELAALVQGDGCAIYEHTLAQPPVDGDPCTVQAERGRVTAADVLVCTHSAFLGLSQFDLRVAPYQSYVLSVRTSSELPDALFWDDEQPYHYIRRATAGDPHLILIGGADHKTGQGDAQEAYRQLARYARSRFPVEQIELRWSAELFEPADGLPLVGRVPFADHLFVSTGYSGTGLTFGTLAGQVLADLVLKRTSRMSEILSPARVKAAAAVVGLVSENLNAARHFLTDRFAEDTESISQIPFGEGRLVKHQGRQVAVYRDEAGAVHACSPVCTHMGCHVRWNNAEKTWDCPCHGGRFSALGERLYGPPPDDLQQLSLDEM